MELIVQPKYVWLTTGKGTWTNMLGAKNIAKKAAGVDTFRYIPVNHLEESNFELVDQKKFLTLSENKPVYSHGIVVCSEKDPCLSVSVGALTDVDWGCVYYSARYKLNEVENLHCEVEDYLVRRYEYTIKKQAGSPTISTINQEVKKDRWSAVVAMAMILT